MEVLDKKTLIVGGGLAGLSLGVIFKKCGIQVEIIEKADSLIPPDTGMLLSQHAVRILAELGLDKSVLESGYPIKNGFLHNELGTRLATLKLNNLERKFGKTHSILRSTLLKELRGYLDDSQIKLNTDILDLENTRESAKVRFNTGEEKEYNLVIGADGAYSKIRSMIFPKKTNVVTNFSSVRFLVKDISIESDSVQEIWGEGRRFGIVPLGGGKVYCYGIFKRNHSDTEPESYQTAIRDLYKNFKGVVPEVLEKLPEDNEIIFNTLPVVKLDHWARKRVILIGDSAHALLPNLGQGGALAMEDAARLSQHLNFCNLLNQGLKSFAAEQRRKVRRIQTYANLVGTIGHMEGKSSRVRDTILKVTPNSLLLQLMQPALIHT